VQPITPEEALRVLSDNDQPTSLPEQVRVGEAMERFMKSEETKTLVASVRSMLISEWASTEDYERQRAAWVGMQIIESARSAASRIIENGVTAKYTLRQQEKREKGSPSS